MGRLKLSLIGFKVQLKQDVRVYHSCLSVCLTVVPVCGLRQQECEMASSVCESQRGVGAASRGQGTLLEIPDMPVFPRMSRDAVQTQLCLVNYTVHTKPCTFFKLFYT